MKAMNFQLAAPGTLGAWVGLGRSSKSVAPLKANGKPAEPSLIERFDRWLWKQHVRDREAYLADSKDIFELEERIRQLERSVGSRYY